MKKIFGLFAMAALAATGLTCCGGGGGADNPTTATLKQFANGQRGFILGKGNMSATVSTPNGIGGTYGSDENGNKRVDVRGGIVEITTSANANFFYTIDSEAEGVPVTATLTIDFDPICKDEDMIDFFVFPEIEDDDEGNGGERVSQLASVEIEMNFASQTWRSILAYEENDDGEKVPVYAGGTLRVKMMD